MDMDNPTVLILQIEQLWRQRQDWLRAYNRLLLQAGAICRRYEAGDKRAAAALLKKLVKGTVEHPAAMAVAPLLIAMEQLEPHLQRAEQGAITLARKLPIATWCKTVRGVGVDGVALASIVGEAGDVTRFRTVSCFWKRMGLAPCTHRGGAPRLDQGALAQRRGAHHEQTVSVRLLCRMDAGGPI